MSQTRIYVVLQTSAAPKRQRLVEATSAAQAIRHCVSEVYTAMAATPKAVVEAMQSGVVVERAIEKVSEQTTKQGEN